MQGACVFAWMKVNARVNTIARVSVSASVSVNAGVSVRAGVIVSARVSVSVCVIMCVYDMRLCVSVYESAHEYERESACGCECVHVCEVA